MTRRCVANSRLVIAFVLIFCALIDVYFSKCADWSRRALIASYKRAPLLMSLQSNFISSFVFGDCPSGLFVPGEPLKTSYGTYVAPGMTCRDVVARSGNILCKPFFCTSVAGPFDYAFPGIPDICIIPRHSAQFSCVVCLRAVDFVVNW